MHPRYDCCAHIFMSAICITVRSLIISPISASVRRLNQVFALIASGTFSTEYTPIADMRRWRCISQKQSGSFAGHPHKSGLSVNDPVADIGALSDRLRRRTLAYYKGFNKVVQEQREEHRLVRDPSLAIDLA